MIGRCQFWSLVLGLTVSVIEFARAEEPVHDLVIRNARIIDGTGAAAFDGSVAIHDGRVEAVGSVTGSGRREIDAGGKVVAPGFIDVHSHGENIVELPAAENYLRMGVTTIVVGNCGSSRVNVGDFFSEIAKIGVGVNMGTLIGHGTVRAHVMGGSFMRPPDDGELSSMVGLVEEGMADGALGMSTGLIYLPGAFAKPKEIAALASVVARHDGIYASHMRNESDEIDAALDELIGIGASAQVRVHVSHIKLGGSRNWGQASRILGRLDEARMNGTRITQDQYLYTASSTGMSQLIPKPVREGTTEDFRRRMSDPAIRAETIREMEEYVTERGVADYAYAVISEYPADTRLNGLNLREAARLVSGDDGLRAQVELALRIHENGGASGVFFGMSERDIETFLRDGRTMIAADSSVKSGDGGMTHPRGFGNNARLLERYVREHKVLDLEEAVRRVTSLPAETFRIPDRGVIRVGAWADLVVFDPASVKERATYESPRAFATGFDFVVVNGEVAVEGDRVTDVRAGRPIRRGE